MPWDPFSINSPFLPVVAGQEDLGRPQSQVGEMLADRVTALKGSWSWQWVERRPEIKLPPTPCAIRWLCSTWYVFRSFLPPSTFIRPLPLDLDRSNLTRTQHQTSSTPSSPSKVERCRADSSPYCAPSVAPYSVCQTLSSRARLLSYPAAFLRRCCVGCRNGGRGRRQDAVSRGRSCRRCAPRAGRRNRRRRCGAVNSE